MADLLTLQETAISDLLISIQGQLTDSGYTYYTSAGSVNVEDRVLGIALSTSGSADNVLYNIYQVDEGETSEDVDISFNAYVNKLVYRIEASVTNLGSEGYPRYTINEKMNQVLADMKAVFGQNYTLNGTCDRAFYQGSNRVYTKMNNVKRTGTIHFFLSVQYSQNVNNPNIIACDY